MSEERMNPPIEAPTSSMVPGMSAANIFDSSLPGPHSQPGPQRPVTWVYDFDPATGSSRATFEGEVVAGIISTPGAGVSAFNGRTGSVTLETADLSALDALFNPSPALQGVPTTPTAAAGTADQTVASCQFVAQAVAAGAGVTAFNGRAGAVTLQASDITTAGGLTNPSPALLGVPTAPTAPLSDSSGTLATTAFVNNWGAQNTVLSFNGRRGNVTLNLADVTSVGGAPISSPSFQGVPVVPTAAPGTSTGQAASTAFVMNQITESTGGVVSFNGRSGVVTLTTSDVTGAGGAPNDSPVLSGVPQAPTPSAGDASDKIATTQFVETAITSMAPVVTTWNGRSGAVSLQLADVTAVGGAPLASPVFTGTPAAPEPVIGDNSTRIATTSFIAGTLASYVTQTSLAGQLAEYVPLAGNVTMNGPLTINSATSPALTIEGTGGNLTMDGTLTAGALVSDGLGNIATNLTVGGTVSASGSITGVSLNINDGSSLVHDSTGSGYILYTAGDGYYFTAQNEADPAFRWGNAVGGDLMQLNSSGALWILGNLTQASDQSLKTDIEELSLGIELVRQLVPKSYRRGEGPIEWGFVAQDVEPVIPAAVSSVSTGEGTLLALDVTAIVATLTLALKQLDERVAALERKVAA